MSHGCKMSVEYEYKYECECDEVVLMWGAGVFITSLREQSITACARLRQETNFEIHQKI